MGNQIETSYNTTTQQNLGYQAASALQLRLDCDKEIEKMEMFLKGAIMVIEQQENGTIKLKTITKSRPKANAEGIHGILHYVQSVFNPQVVQANFPSDSQAHSRMYEQYVMSVRKNFAFILCVNRIDWGIDENEMDLICDSFMNIAKAFMTRPIDNKERDSYNMQVREGTVMRTGSTGGGFPNPFASQN